MNNKQKHRHSPNPPAEVTRPSVFSNAVLFGMLGVLGGLLGYAGWQIYHADSEPTPVVVVTPEASATPPTPATQPATPAVPANSQILRGKWVRDDGGYVLEIKSVADNGKLEAAYLNPKPINVAKAEATTVNGQLQVFVELRDVNYLGSTYDLRYDPGRDQLIGEYFLAAQQQRFPVSFSR